MSLPTHGLGQHLLFTMTSNELNDGDPLVNKTMWIMIGHLVLNLNIFIIFKLKQENIRCTFMNFHTLSK